LRQIDQARGDLYAIADELEVLKLQIAHLPSRSYVSRRAQTATGTVWALIATVALSGSALAAEAADLAGTARVMNGDTISIADTRIRLWGIDAPEREQTYIGQILDT
jgi:endonuclease YncB( thermonuclease family)